MIQHPASRTFSYSTYALYRVIRIKAKRKKRGSARRVMMQEQNKKPFDTSQCFCQVPVSKQLLQQRTILQAFCQIHSQTGFELSNYQKGFNWSSKTYLSDFWSNFALCHRDFLLHTHFWSLNNINNKAKEVSGWQRTVLPFHHKLTGTFIPEEGRGTVIFFPKKITQCLNGWVFKLGHKHRTKCLQVSHLMTLL